MHTYRVFNENNVLVEVTQQELDDAAAGHDELPAHLASAAGAARRRDLIGRLRATLGATSRHSKLAAARSLLALADRESIALLRERSATEADATVANMYRAIALRLEGVEPVRRAFAAGDDDPELAGLLASIYTGEFDLVPGDLELLLEAATAYVTDVQRWIAGMKRDEWRSDLYVLVTALSRGAAQIADRERARSVLTQVIASRADRDTKSEARKLLGKL